MEEASGQDGEIGRMRYRGASWLAWLASCSAIVCACFGVLLLVLNGVGIGSKEFDYSAAGAVLGVAFSTVGGVVASQRPANLIGWLFLAVGLSQGFDSLDTQYGRYALVTNPGSLPGGSLMVWMASWTFVPGLALAATLTLLLFPTGRLPSSRWRWVAWAVAAAIALMVVPPAVVLWPMKGPALVGGADPARIAGGWVLSLEKLGLLLIVVCMIASASSLVFRFRRAGGQERQQLKWLTYAGVVFIVIFVSSLFVPRPVRASEIWPVVSLVLLVTVYPSIPVAVGVAIMRHRLYDIDLLINRTLVYGTLTATLVALYFGGIVLSQMVFVVFTGQQSTLAVVASTLVIAALFTPLRRRIQSFIDRSFYRNKYDARKTLEAFSVKLRDETDLEALNQDLVGVVKETMQPAHVSLWLHAETTRKREQV